MTVHHSHPKSASGETQGLYPVTRAGYAKTRNFGTFKAKSFSHIPAYLIGLHDDRCPIVDMAPWMPEPDFEAIHNEIVGNWGAKSGIAYPCNPVAGEQPPDLCDNRYHLDELYFHLDEQDDSALIQKLRSAESYWERAVLLSLERSENLIEWGVLHELKFPGQDWNLNALRRFPRLISYLLSVPMEIKRAYFLVYRPGERTSIHRDDIRINPSQPWHGCLMNFQQKPHPTFVYDPITRQSVDCPSWASSINFCDYHGGHLRTELSYTVRIDGWFDGIGGFRHGVPVWDGDWDKVRTVPNPHLG